jgi:hypothetical protein
MQMSSEDEVSSATKSAEEAEAHAPHEADRAATEEEAAAAERGRGDSEEQERVAEHAEEMADIGAHVKGEGEIK